MAIIKEFEVKANTNEAVESVEKLKEKIEDTEEKVVKLEKALEKANKTASKGAQESTEEDREAKRMKEEVIKTIDRATGGYLEMGKKAKKAYTVISAEVTKGIGLAKQWIQSFSFSDLIGKVKAFGLALQASFKAGTLGAKALRAGLVATGIGALVVALGAIVAYWDDIKGAVSGVSKEQKKQLEYAESNVEAQMQASEALSLQENSLKLQGKSEKEIRDLKIQQTNQTITALEAQLTSQKQIKKSQVEASKRNKAILQGIIRFLTAPLSLLLATVDMVGKALGQDFKLEEKFSGGIAKLVFDPDEVEAEADEAIEETEKQLAKLKSTRDGYLLDEKKEQEQARKGNLDAAKNAYDLEMKMLKSFLDAKRKAQEDFALNERQREQIVFNNNLKRLEEQEKEELSQKGLTEQAKKYITDKYQILNEQELARHKGAVQKLEDEANAEALKQYQKLEDLRLGLMAEGEEKELAELEIKFARLQEAEMGNLEALLLIQDTYEKERAAVQDKYDNEAVKKRKDFQNQIADIVVDAANTTIKNLMELNDIYDKNDEAAAKRAFERNKSLQIIQAVINTASGIMTQLAVPQDALTGANFVKAALVATTGATSIATIAAQKFNGGKATGGGSAPKAPAPPQVAPSFNIVGQGGTNQLLQGIAGQFSQPLRAYVVGGDVTSSQEMERKRIKTATFG